MGSYKPHVRFDFELRKYQRYATMMCEKLNHAILAIDMSLGKTAAVLTFLLMIFEKYRKVRVLVVAPKLVATDTWPDEIKLWRHLRPLRKQYAVLVGTPEQRRRALRKDCFLYIINKENLQWLWQEIGGEDGWFWDILIIDEASMLKDGKKRTTRAGGGKGSKPLSRFGIIARARKLCWKIIEMTGTPSPEGIHNMWGLVYVLDGGYRLGASKEAFTERWFDTGYSGYEMKPRDGAREEIIDLCSDLMISLAAGDHIELPPVKTYRNGLKPKWVTLPPDVMREYRKFERELYTEKYDVEAVSSGVLVNKLLQFANGSMYRERGNAIPIHECKIDALEELLEELDGHHAMIAWSYKFDKDAMRRRFGKKITFFDEYGKNVLKDWNAGKIRNLAVHPKSLSHGTNLQFGGWNAIWFGLQDSGETYRQFNMRLPRPGQPHPWVAIHHILARGTRDEDVIDSQEYKQADEMMLREATRVTKEDVDRAMAEWDARELRYRRD